MFSSSIARRTDDNTQYYWQELGLSHDPFISTDEHIFRVGQWENYFELLSHLSQHSSVMEIILGDREIGKSNFAKQFAQSVNGFMAVSLIQANASWSMSQFLHVINVSLGFAQNEISTESLDMINAHLPSDDMKYVIVIDDAEKLSEEILLALKEWTHNLDDRHRLRFILVAEKQLKHRLKLIYTNQEHEKLLHVFELKPLDIEQTHAYLQHCLVNAGFEGDFIFSQKEVKKIHKESNGFFGEINAVGRRELIDKLFKGKSINLIIQENSNAFLFGAIGLIILSLLLFSRSGGKVENTTSQLALPQNKFDLSPAEQPTKEEYLSDVTVLDDIELQQGTPFLDEPKIEESIPTSGDIPLEALTVNSGSDSNSEVEPKASVTAKPSRTSNVESKDIIQEREKIILMEPGNNYTIQLMAGDSPKAATNFIKNNKLEDNANYYINRMQSRIWYSVIYGSYKSKEEARLAITRMPFKLRKNNPWIRKYQEVQRIIIASNPSNNS